MINILETVEVNFIVSVFRALSGWLDSIVYSLVQLLFNIFFAVSETTINDTIVYEIFNRVGLIIGVFMLFVIGFNLITYIINPDMISDKKRGTGNLIFRIIISVVLLASVNSLFTFARRFEVAVVNSNFIGKVITGNDSSFSQSIDNGSIGNFFSAEVFFSFLSCKSSDCQGEMSAYSIENLKKFVSTADSFWILPNYVNLQDTGKNYLYEYKTIWSTITGILMIYILCNYVLSIGVRVIQLAYLQLIAPIPILFNILPNGEDKLKKWGKQAFTTYLDLFLRLIIIYLVLFFMTNVFSTDSLFIYSDKATDFMTMVKIVIMLGLMMFAKKAPDLIKELFPSSGAASGDFGLNLKKRFKDNLAGKGLALVGSAATLGAGKLRAGIDARKNGLRFRDGTRQVRANNKLRKWLDDTAPYSREQRKKELEAGSNNYAREKLIDDGRDNYWNNNGTLTANSFSDQAYRNSWQSVEDAKAAVKTAEIEMAAAQSELNAAYSSGDDKAKEKAVKRYEKAQKAVKSANGVLEYRKQRHEDMKKLHSADARIEDSFDAYKKATSDEEKAQDKANRGKNGRGGNSSEGNTAQAPNVDGATGNGTTQNSSSSGDAAQAPNVTGATGNGVTQNSSSSSSPSFFGDDGGESGE